MDEAILVRRPSRMDRAARRMLDLGIAVPALVLLAPLMGALALAIRWTSPGPALFTQVRAGRDGRPFFIYKFRTMTVSAGPVEDVRLAREDARITRIGHVLRRFSLDELPQLLNVIEGTMSLVGPRPTVLEQVAKYDARQRRRLETKPGLTGWAQVNGRNALPWAQRIELDLWYVEHASVWLDMIILFRTIRVVALGEGVYGAGGVNQGL